MNHKKIRSKHLHFACAAGLVAALISVSSHANGLGENGSWQFQNSVDKANLAAVQDMIQKRNMGYYNAQVYTTNIARQINCNVTAQATGNEGTLGAAALSPATSGATSTTTGNESASTSSSTGMSSNDQANSGSLGANVNGGTSSGVSGDASQSLKSSQTNSGSQSASVGGSTACTIGVLN
jgi:hypothetical protein